ncbi:MAG: paraquat-inducible protein A [Alphaproteobacteria bacterium]|jgi:paraquat-inducible protein A
MTNQPLSRDASGLGRLTGWALLLSLPLMMAGVALPSLHLQNLWVLQQDYSLLSATLAFWDKGYCSLFVLLFTFTILFPIIKIAAGLWLFFRAFREPQNLRRWIGPLSALSKWSMLDVFVIAVVVLALEGSLITAADLGPGIALFAGSVLLSGWAYGRLTSLLKRRIERES